MSIDEAMSASSLLEAHQVMLRPESVLYTESNKSGNLLFSEYIKTRLDFQPKLAATVGIPERRDFMDFYQTGMGFNIGHVSSTAKFKAGLCFLHFSHMHAQVYFHLQIPRPFQSRWNYTKMMQPTTEYLISCGTKWYTF